MKFARFSGSFFIVAAAALSACSSGSDPAAGGAAAGDGNLSVRLMDAPVENVTAVYVEIAGLSVKTADGPATEIDLPQGPFTVNLLELGESNAAILIDHEALPAGEYNWLEMDVNAAHDGNMDSYVMTTVGGQEELRVPSGRVRLIGDFEVSANQSVSFLLDWDLRKGLVDPIGLPGYLLKPVFRVLRVDEYGLLSGTVDPLILDDASCSNDDDVDISVGNLVYVYQDSDAAPVDIDGIDPEPIATAAVAQDMAGDYVYSVALMPGDYTVALTCEGANDLPESGESLVFIQPTNVTMDADGEIVEFTQQAP
jgi:hypothetical protein